MASDCTVAIDNGYINIRVGAIIMKGNKFLMVGKRRNLLNYLAKKDIQRYRDIVEKLGLRK